MAYTGSKAFSGKGTVLSIGTAGATPVYTPVGELKTFSFSGSKNDTVDVTNSDSTGRAKEFIVTLLEAGEVSISGNYVAADAGQTAFKAAFNSGAILPYKIVLPLAPTQTTSGDTLSFQGLCIEDQLDLQYDKEIGFSGKIKLSGVITYTTGT